MTSRYYGPRSRAEIRVMFSSSVVSLSKCNWSDFAKICFNKKGDQLLWKAWVFSESEIIKPKKDEATSGNSIFGWKSRRHQEVVVGSASPPSSVVLEAKPFGAEGKSRFRSRHIPSTLSPEVHWAFNRCEDTESLLLDRRSINLSGAREKEHYQKF